MKTSKEVWFKASHKKSNIAALGQLDYEESWDGIVTELVLLWGEEKTKEFVLMSEKNYVKFIEGN